MTRQQLIRLDLGLKALLAGLLLFAVARPELPHFHAELGTAYTDRLGDPALGRAGSAVAALVTISGFRWATRGASRAGAR